MEPWDLERVVSKRVVRFVKNWGVVGWGCVWCCGGEVGGWYVVVAHVFVGHDVCLVDVVYGWNAERWDVGR